ncbi:MAG TPA: phospholipid carrier-dependent glycosyltransferase, partial [Candidatus Dormibacteraeota bacterium]|nr:phospholipid carrier-dependent glycosyltransferase [Candidatus Dormibacteraeota bacterium]
MAALGLGLTLHGLGSHPLVDFDEAVHAGFIRRMARGGGWLVPVFDGSVRLRKPPLYFWLGALVVLAGGHASVLADRLPSAVAGVALAVLLAEVARRRWGLGRVGWVAGAGLLTMPYFLLLSRSAMLDALSAALVAAAVLAGSWWLRGRGGAGMAALTGLALGLTVLERSAMVLLPLAILAVDGLGLRAWRRVRLRDAGLAAGLACLVGAAWPLAMTIEYGGFFWHQYLVRNVLARVASHVESHPRPVYYYLPLLAAGLGAWAPPLALAMTTSWRRAWREPDSIERLAAIWILVGVGLFSVAGTKLPWYMAPVYPGCALLLAGFLHRWLAPGGDPSGAPTSRETALLVGAAGLGVAMGLWPDPRPVGALGVAGLVGLAGLWASRSQRSAVPARSGGGPTGVAGWGGGRRAAGSLALAAVLAVALGRAALFPATIGSPGLAMSLQPEPPAAAEAALGAVAARAPGVPLGIVGDTYPTVLYYSRRATITTFPGGLRAAARARGLWLVLPAAQLPALRRLVAVTTLARAAPLVLVALPGAPQGEPARLAADMRSPA